MEREYTNKDLETLALELGLQDKEYAKDFFGDSSGWRFENWSAEDLSAYVGGGYTLPKGTK